MPKRLNIFTQIETIDWISFHQIYTPILGIEAAHLYINFYCQKQIFKHLNIDSYDLDTFIDNLNISKNFTGSNKLAIDFETVKRLLKLLEKLNLVKAYLKEDWDGTNYCIKLLPPLSIKQAMCDSFIKEQLQTSLTEHKFSEMCLLSDENQHELGLRVDLGSEDNISAKSTEIVEIIQEEKPKDTNSKLTEIDKSVSYEFYNSIFQATGKVFEVSDQTWQLVKDAHLGDAKIPMGKLQFFAMNSLKQKNKKHYVCQESFEYLINSEINPNNDELLENDYKTFWVSLLYTSDKDNKDKFKKLFSKHSPINFYMQLLKKDNYPKSLGEWINDCTQNKNFSFSIVNALISFARVWIQKITVNYLIKVSNTIYKNNLLNTENFIEYFKNIIYSDINGRNKLQIKSRATHVSEENDNSKNYVRSSSLND